MTWFQFLHKVSILNNDDDVDDYGLVGILMMKMMTMRMIMNWFQFLHRASILYNDDDVDDDGLVGIIMMKMMTIAIQLILFPA